MDVSDPAALKVVQTLTLDGSYVEARMIGGTVRLVSSSSVPIELPYVTPAGATAGALAAAKAKNQAVVAASRATAWLPGYRLGKRAARPLVSCRRRPAPAGFSGLGMLTVTTIDLAKGLAPVDSTAVMTDGRIVYASPTRPLRRDRAVVGAAASRHADRDAAERTRPRSTPSTSPTRRRPSTSAAAPFRATC